MKGDNTICLETPDTLLVLARRGDVWAFAHLGAKGGDPDELAVLAAARPYACNHLAAGTAETYPAFGSTRGQNGFALGNSRGALQVRHADGDCSVDWTCTGIACDNSSRKERNGRKVGSQSDSSLGNPAPFAAKGSHVAITYADKAHPSFTAVQHFVAHADCDVFETWVELRHDEEGPVALSRMDSFCLETTGLGDRFHLLSLSGHWASEANVAEDELLRGREVVLGARSGVHDSWENAPAFMLSVGPAPAREESGAVLAGALCWSGAWEMRFRHEWSHELRVSAGAANLSGPYVLEPGRTLALPKFVFSWSERGKGAASRALHAWARRHLMPHAGAPRPIVLNSWEGVKFDLSEKRLVAMMDGARALGAECFVVDDGWFGRGAFARNDAGHGLGDWTHDPAKFPGGLAPLAREAKKRGLKLGLWFEPEMADVESELLRNHPDWALREPGRPRRLQRGGGQVVLDLPNPAVRDAVFRAVDDAIRAVPGLSYVKIDANAEIANFASPWLGPERQGNLWFDYAAGLYEILARLRAAHPRIVFQSCASGGGRTDFGALAFADEFWASDNTGAQQRALIQWGWGQFLPACAMAAHVTASPNRHTRRSSSLKYRFDVAFSGRLGIELRPEELSEGEIAYARRRVAEYKRLRPVIQGGDTYRLASPYEGDHAALLFVAPDRRRAVVTVCGLSRKASDGRLAPLRLLGLDPDRRYRIREIDLALPGEAQDRPVLPGEAQNPHTAFSGRAFSGAALAAAGIPFDLGPGDDSFVLELSTVRS
ncbi:MAG: alpha-galactosidase [Kiritimatiellae bacterium]|nr:alpha-galactosidase [Kiritimatiellia bacterium]